MAVELNQTNGFCEAVLTGISMVNPLNSPEIRGDRNGTLVALNDAENRTAEIASVYGEGVNTQVRIKTLKRPSPSQVSDSKICAQSDMQNYDEEVVGLTQFKTIPIGISLDTMSKYCNDAWAAQTAIRENNQPQITPAIAEVSKRVNLALSTLRTSIEKDLLDIFAGAFGKKLTTGSDAVSDLVMLDVDGNPIYSGYSNLQEEYYRSGYSGTPLIVGQGKFAQFNTAIGFGCCNANGVDYNAMASNAPYKFFYSTQTDQILGTDEFMVIAPGSAQFFSYAKNKRLSGGMKRVGTADLSSFRDPLYPMVEYDLKVIGDECTENWTIIIEATYGLWTQENGYQTYDRLNGTNGLLNYRATQKSS